jgi:anthranilate phosphoribosyltransferase
MKSTLDKLFQHQELSQQDAYNILTRIGKGDFNSSQIAAFLTVYLMRNITVNELSGFRNALLDLCLKVDLSDFNTIDVCGTGGDNKDTFNISTLSAFVVAGAGYKVAKHGNYSVSSACGSSNVLEYLGYKFSSDESVLNRQLEKAGICVMHAPLFHPAMKNVVPVRRDLGIKTFFNMLGPLVNPSFPKHQFTGVFNLELARIYNYLLQDTEVKFNIVHSLDGYDEISLTGPFKVYSNRNESIVSPEHMGFDKIKASEIYGGDSVEQAGKIFTKILDRKGSKVQDNVVIANAAYAIKVFENDLSIDECIDKARESLESGKAKKALTLLLDN